MKFIFFFAYLMSHSFALLASDCSPPYASVLNQNQYSMAPRNLQVLVEFPKGWYFNGAPSTVPIRQIDFILKREKCNGNKCKVTLRKEYYGDAETEIVKLSPVRLLDAGKKYHLSLVGAELQEMEILGTIRVGRDIKKSHPRWSGILERTFRPALEKTPLGPINASVYLTIQKQSPYEDRVFAIWKADSAGRFDESRPPLTFASSVRGQINIILNAATGCGAARLSVSKDDKTLHLRLRAVDIAGNMSKPHYTTVDLVTTDAGKLATPEDR